MNPCLSRGIRSIGSSSSSTRPLTPCCSKVYSIIEVFRGIRTTFTFLWYIFRASRNLWSWLICFIAVIIFCISVRSIYNLFLIWPNVSRHLMELEGRWKSQSILINIRFYFNLWGIQFVNSLNSIFCQKLHPGNSIKRWDNSSIQNQFERPCKCLQA